MGRTIPPHRWIFEQEKNYWYKRLRKGQYIKYAEELFSGAAYYNEAGGFWSIGQVREKVLFLILFYQCKKLKELEKKCQ